MLTTCLAGLTIDYLGKTSGAKLFDLLLVSASRQHSLLDSVLTISIFYIISIFQVISLLTVNEMNSKVPPVANKSF